MAPVGEEEPCEAAEKLGLVVAEGLLKGAAGSEVEEGGGEVPKEEGEKDEEEEPDEAGGGPKEDRVGEAAVAKDPGVAAEGDREEAAEGGEPDLIGEVEVGAHEEGPIGKGAGSEEDRGEGEAEKIGGRSCDGEE